MAELLAIYLNDHLAGATLGVQLARRLRGSNEGDPTFGRPLMEICAEIEADRTTLEALMDRLEIRRSRIKQAGAWAAEKVGRLKLNGQLRGYSPLSRLLELETLQIGIGGKAQLWKVLELALGRGPGGIDFARLAARAERQRLRVEELHAHATRKALRDD
jgi:hypothetical protein